MIHTKKIAIRCLLIGALLLPRFALADPAPDSMSGFREALAYFHDRTSDYCAAPNLAPDHGEHEVAVFSQAQSASLESLKTQPNGEAQILSALQNLVAASTEINATWPDENRFHYKLYRFPGLLVVSVGFRNQSRVLAFGKPNGDKPWAIQDVGDYQDWSPSTYTEIIPLKPAAGNHPRFLARFESSGCAGGMDGIKYQVYEWDAANEYGLNELLSRDGVLDLENENDKVWTDESGERVKGATGQLQVLDTRLSLPYCKISAVDYWDHAELCYIDNYTLTDSSVRFERTLVNDPELNTIAKAIEYAKDRDVVALAGYTANEAVARRLVRDIPPNTFPETGYVATHRTKSSVVLSTPEDGLVFTLQKAKGHWLISDFKISGG